MVYNSENCFVGSLYHLASCVKGINDSETKSLFWSRLMSRTKSQSQNLISWQCNDLSYYLYLHSCKKWLSYIFDQNLRYTNTFIRRLVHCTHECSPLGVWWALVNNRDKNILTTQRLFGAWGKLLTIEQRDIDIYVVKKIIDM